MFYLIFLNFTFQSLKLKLKQNGKLMKMVLRKLKHKCEIPVTK